MALIMTVDDTASMRQMISFTLDSAGHEVAQAADGKQAFDMAKEKKFDLIIADVNMPNMDGIQLLGEIKGADRWKHLPVVMVTTEGSESKVMTAANLGAAGYVRKPFSAEEFRRTLDGLL